MKQAENCPQRTGFAILILLSLLLGLSICRADTPRPNILLIMADDLGYSDLGCYGGEIKTPNLDSLAEGGVRFTQFYNTGRCWPTRASLLTGFYPHGIRRDKVQGIASGNRGVRPSWAPVIASRLKAGGYRSYHTGKWHLDSMPIASGFDRSYYLKDQHRFFSPTLHWKNDIPLPPIPKGSDYYATVALGDHVLECIDDHVTAHRDQPFFHYLAFTAPHFPLHALPKDIERYRDRYNIGWDLVRQTRWEKIQSLGLVQADLSKVMPTVGPPYHFPDALKQLGKNEISRPLKWDSLTDTQQDFQSSKMQIHAAMVDCMDQQVGRIIHKLRDQHLLDNTVVFFLSDNGASAEIMVRGDGHDAAAERGAADSHLCLGPGWSTTANTPFRYHKTWTHEGGTATPLIVHWTKGIEAVGAIRHQVGHVIDLWPTIAEITGVDSVSTASALFPRPGRSLIPFLDSDQTEPRTIWWSHEANRALRIGNWKIAAAGNEGSWELYDLSTDRTETTDLAAQHPEKVEEMSIVWKTINTQQSNWALQPN
ncbi:arylsulfatase [Rhodopirellula sp.]|nr:arylsulfatase [Rhodopirellula sp.]MDB4679240.1 arylsulfatase [Rhodopirellula sp.]